MTKLRRVKDGDVFYVKIGDDTYAVGIVLNSSKIFVKLMLVNFYDLLFSKEGLDDLDLSLLKTIPLIKYKRRELPAYTDKIILSRGVWTHIDCWPQLLIDISQPFFKYGVNLYQKDIKVGDTRVDNIFDLDEVINDMIDGYLVIESLLRRHFGIQND